MAHTISTAKRIRQNERRRKSNRAFHSQVRTIVKRVLSAVDKKDTDGARKAFQAACSSLDKAASKGIIHANAAARKKSRLAARINALSGAAK